MLINGTLRLIKKGDQCQKLKQERVTWQTALWKVGWTPARRLRWQACLNTFAIIEILLQNTFELPPQHQFHNCTLFKV